MNDLSRESGKVKEKEQDMIDVMYKMIIEHKEKVMKIKEIKNFFIELSSLSSSSQQPVTSLIQTPIIQPIIPSVTKTTPLQQTPPQPAQSSEEEQRKENNNQLITSVIYLFITSTLKAEEFQRRARGLEKGEDLIIIPQEPSLLPHMMATTSDDNDNNSKKRVEANPPTENMKEQELEEDGSDIEDESSEANSLIDNEDDDIINNNIDYDDSSNIDCYDNASDISMVIKRDNYGDIYE
jgi:hypothetical protein